MLATVIASVLAGVAGASPVIEAQLQPAVSANIARATTPATLASQWIIIGDQASDGELRRSADGLFYVTAIVNGSPVRFLVDTGASMVVLTAQDAQRIGVSPAKSEFTEDAGTANGRAAMARVVLQDVSVGSLRTSNLNAAVVRDGLDVSLLGQNWLSQLASVTITGDRMILR